MSHEHLRHLKLRITRRKRNGQRDQISPDHDEPFEVTRTVKKEYYLVIK